MNKQILFGSLTNFAIREGKALQNASYRSLFRFVFPSRQKLSKNLLFLGLICVCLSCDEATEPPLLPKTEIFSFTNLDEDSISNGTRYTYPNSTLQFTGWGVYEDIIFPGTEIEWSMNKVPSPTAAENEVLKCAITRGDQYNNVFFTNTCALRWEGEDWEYNDAQYLIFELDFFVEGEIDCANPNNSTLEGIEFTWQHILLPRSHGFGVQWSKGGAWRFWNHNDDENGQVIGWQDFQPNISSCLTANEWHRIKLEGYYYNNHIRYQTMSVDGTSYNLTASIPQADAANGWVENFLQVGMQINGNTAIDPSHGHGVDPVTVYLDNVSFKGYSFR